VPWGANKHRGSDPASLIYSRRVAQTDRGLLDGHRKPCPNVGSMSAAGGS
jgi:hypothetical protein